jgi:ribosomal-protein-alanine N-acetyltransferase
VVLRSPTIDDRSEYVSLRRRSRALLLPWEPHTPRGGLPAPAKVFERLLLTASTETSVRFLIIERSSGRIAGQVSINQIFRGPFNNALLGYWLGEGWTGKGYMTEALALAVEHAFGTLGLHRVEANIIPSNAPSMALVKRLGFRREGVAKRYLQIAGKYQDHVHWALTSEEWPTRGAKAVLGGRKAARSTRQRPRTT